MQGTEDVDGGEFLRRVLAVTDKVIDSAAESIDDGSLASIRAGLEGKEWTDSGAVHSVYSAAIRSANVSDSTWDMELVYQLIGEKETGLEAPGFRVETKMEKISEDDYHWSLRFAGEDPDLNKGSGDYDFRELLEDYGLADAVEEEFGSITGRTDSLPDGEHGTGWTGYISEQEISEYLEA